MNQTARIVQVSVSNGGAPKRAVAEARVGALGLDGDAHRDMEHHGARYTSPRVNITRAFKNGDYSRVSQKRHPGWSRVYARVLAGGVIRPGDPVRLVDEIESAEVLAAARG